MARAHRGSLVHPVRPAGSSIDGHFFLGLLQILIVLGALIGAIGAMTMGENNLAIMIGLVGGALIAGKMI